MVPGVLTSVKREKSYYVRGNDRRVCIFSPEHIKKYVDTVPEAERETLERPNCYYFFGGQ